ncbi:MAG: TetR/AcrR family transcriptional regulator [Acidobacteria bacterium]|nr:TetR/AcrR family transcriptional regulator [Acidobacteriota bacterium]
MDRIEAARRAPFGNSPEVGARGARTHRRVIDAGLSVFADVGYIDASISAITEAAGCSRASFYQYFASKEDLFLQMTTLVASEQIVIFDRLEAVTPDGHGRDAVHAWLIEYIEHYHTYSPVFGAYNALTQYDSSVTEGAARVYRRLAKRLASKFHDTPPTWQDPQMGALLLVTLVSRTPALWRVAEAGIDRDRLASSLADLVHRCVYGPIAGVNVNDYRGLAETRIPDVGELSAPIEADRAEGGTRDLLLAAGRETFPRLGHHGTRVDDIVAEAGVAHGTFYRYFEDKDDLFVQLAQAAVEGLTELVASFPASGDAASLRSWFTTWFDTYDDSASLVAVWVSAAESSPAVRDLGFRLAIETGTSVGSVLVGHASGDLPVDTIALLAWLERLPVNVASLRLMSKQDAVNRVTALVQQGMLSADQPAC